MDGTTKFPEIELLGPFDAQRRQRGPRLHHQAVCLCQLACGGEATAQAQLHQIAQAVFGIHLLLSQRDALLHAAHAKVGIGGFRSDRDAHAVARCFSGLRLGARSLRATTQAAGEIQLPARADTDVFQRLLARVAGERAADFAKRTLHRLPLVRDLRIETALRFGLCASLASHRARLIHARHRGGEIEVLCQHTLHDAHQLRIVETVPPGIERGSRQRRRALLQGLLMRICRRGRDIRPDVVRADGAIRQHRKQGCGSEQS
jgi:hypothetical protein